MFPRLSTLASKMGLNFDYKLCTKFVTWADSNCASKFIDSIKEKAKAIESDINNLDIQFKNGRKGSKYTVEFCLPDCIREPKFIGLEEIGLTCQHSEKETQEHVLSFVISGTLLADGDQEVILEYYHKDLPKGMPPLKRIFRFAVNPDPRDLWKDIPVPEGTEYPKKDTDSIYIPGEASANGKHQKDMVAASRRGRSHAHEGKPRDDDFAVCYCPESDWYILAVADGAGSCEFSREGSRIACETAVNFCKEKLQNPDNEFNQSIKAILDSNSEQKEQAIQKQSYKIIAGAAFAAYNTLIEEAKNKQRQQNLYATTLLLTICKKIPDSSYVILSFNIGDGAIGIIANENDDFKSFLNCIPDEGEFGGQTRFITMSDLFKDSNELMKRIHVRILKNFTAILMMTDGISDAKFETSANLNNTEKWSSLWEELTSQVHLNTPDAPNELLDWLNFWSKGNHDDRTIAILF